MLLNRYFTVMSWPGGCLCTGGVNVVVFYPFQPKVISVAQALLHGDELTLGLSLHWRG